MSQTATAAPIAAPASAPATEAPPAPAAPSSTADLMRTAGDSFSQALAALEAGGASGADGSNATAAPAPIAEGSAKAAASEAPPAGKAAAEAAPGAAKAASAGDTPKAAPTTEAPPAAEAAAEKGAAPPAPAPAAAGSDPAKLDDASIETALRGDPQAWDFVQRRVQAERDRTTARLQSESAKAQAAAKVAADHAPLTAYVAEMTPADRAAFVATMPEYQEAVSRVSAAATDFATLLQAEPAALREAYERGGPPALETAVVAALLAHPEHKAAVEKAVAAAKKDAHEAGLRAGREEARRATSTPPAGAAQPAAAMLPRNFEEGRAAFAAALAQLDV